MSACPCQQPECLLCHARLFRGLKAEQVCAVRGLVSRHACPPHGLLFRAGEPARRLYVLRTGRVKLTRTLPDGREQILGLRGAGDLLGYDALSRSLYTHSAQALTPIAACGFAYRDLREMLAQNETLAWRVIERLHAELARAQAHLCELGQKNATERLASFLVSLLPSNEGAPRRLSLPFTRQEMAQLLGLSIETVSRTLSALVRRGVIRTARGGRECLVLDVSRLRQLSGEEPDNVPCAVRPAALRAGER